MNNYLSTQELAFELTDKLDDLAMTGEITGDLVKKFTSPRRLVKAINEADIDVCGWLKPVTTAVLPLKAGDSDLLIRRAKSLNNDSDGLPSDPTGYNRLNNFVDYSQIKSGFLKVYDQYPLGQVKPIGEVELVTGVTYEEAVETTAGHFATVDYYNGRLRFSASFSTDVFISFQSQVMPLKIAAEVIGRDPLDVYKVRSPHYANELLIHIALMKLIPKNTNYYRLLAIELPEIKTRVYDNTPYEIGVVQIKSTFFDDI